MRLPYYQSVYILDPQTHFCFRCHLRPCVNSVGINPLVGIGYSCGSCPPGYVPNGYFECTLAEACIADPTLCDLRPNTYCFGRGLEYLCLCLEGYREDVDGLCQRVSAFLSISPLLAIDACKETPNGGCAQKWFSKCMFILPIIVSIQPLVSARVNAQIPTSYSLKMEQNAFASMITNKMASSVKVSIASRPTLVTQQQ